jgi:hypothetical protein
MLQFSWSPDELNFLVDGKVYHTVTQASTINATAGGRPEYPSTPTRVEFRLVIFYFPHPRFSSLFSSVWPAGIPSEPNGTVAWSGGYINWSDPEYTSTGYFSGHIRSVSIQCAPLAQTANSSTATGWLYTANNTLGVPQVFLTDATTVLSSAEINNSKNGTNDPSNPSTNSNISKPGVHYAWLTGAALGGLAAVVAVALIGRKIWNMRKSRARGVYKPVST